MAYIVGGSMFICTIAVYNVNQIQLDLDRNFLIPNLFGLARILLQIPCSPHPNGLSRYQQDYSVHQHSALWS